MILTSTTPNAMGKHFEKYKSKVNFCFMPSEHDPGLKAKAYTHTQHGAAVEKYWSPGVTNDP
jgi:hypothetical protein